MLCGRASKVAYAQALALSAAVALGDAADVRARRTTLEKVPRDELTAYAREAFDAALASSTAVRVVASPRRRKQS